jgi:hypothetical protein
MQNSVILHSGFLYLCLKIFSYRETKKLSFASSLLRGVGASAEPHLLTWFTKFRSVHTVKSGNIVTLLSENNFFLKKTLR